MSDGHEISLRRGIQEDLGFREGGGWARSHDTAKSGANGWQVCLGGRNSRRSASGGVDCFPPCRTAFSAINGASEPTEHPPESREAAQVAETWGEGEEQTTNESALPLADCLTSQIP